MKSDSRRPWSPKVSRSNPHCRLRFWSVDLITDLNESIAACLSAYDASLPCALRLHNARPNCKSLHVRGTFRVRLISVAPSRLRAPGI